MAIVALCGLVFSFLFWSSCGVRRLVVIFLLNSVFLLVIFYLLGPLAAVLFMLFLFLNLILWWFLWG